ncbi:hypothetical protein CYMTET_56368 [Cymbomonas tetramitiformis]|uniref:DUF1736 domain-containing protein n=1 Tax=Cymbomonas tetramitiformis TaxID=36881 RepID=A0AAE0EME1_9CHLO|nr:hypothetical protein CYMTET_56368 [Cymbomonas tetramitiformis]
MIWMMGLWLSLWYPSDGYCLFEGVGDSSAAGSIYVQCLGAFSPAGGLVIDTHFMGYWHLVVNEDGHWNDLDDGMWLSMWYPSGRYCLFEGVGDSSAAGSIYVQCLGAFSPAGGLVIDTHFMGYWHLVVNGDGHWNDLDDGMWLSLWYPSDGYCLFEGVGDSSTARFLGVSWIRLTLAPSPCAVLMVITHAGGLVFFDLDMKYWRIAVNGDGRRVEVGFGRRLSLWCHSGGHCLLESSVDSSVVLRGEAEAARMWWAGGSPVWTRHENPIIFAPSLASRAMSQMHVWARCVQVLVCPRVLCCDWGMQSIPLVLSVLDPRNLITAALLMPVTVVVVAGAWSVLSPLGRPLAEMYGVGMGAARSEATAPRKPPQGGRVLLLACAAPWTPQLDVMSFPLVMRTRMIVRMMTIMIMTVTVMMVMMMLIEGAL